MSNFDKDMYDTDDVETTPVLPSQAVTAIGRGMVTEIEINGKKFEVVSPEYMRELQRLMLDMSNKMRTMDRNLQSMSFAIKQQERVIANLRTQLDGKIDRE